MPFTNENEFRELAENTNFQSGRSNIDDDSTVERSIHLPWAKDARASYLYYDCAIGSVLDSGIVVHSRLPQFSSAFIDTLASVPIDDPSMDIVTELGVNLRCRDQYQDVIQRMGHARYWFRIWGQAIRAGYQVPIPGIRSVGGVPVVPHDMNPQWAYNKIMPGGNYGGVVMWYAQWSLWYTTTVPPRSSPGRPDSDAVKMAHPWAHISSEAPVIDRMQAPYSQADDDSERSFQRR